ncbi:Ig-like domain-containing protein [Pseudothermotoga sp. U03pept]|uniref:Ig-like domain-containing protein n=1 Tax=Pseudothermotoga sp. U03pept TaxID=3447012 RepID=UPI003F09FDCF
MKPKAIAAMIVALIMILISCGAPTAINKAPQFVSSSPANGATDVSTSTSLSWTFTDPENDTLNYEVFFGENKSNTPSIYKGSQNSTQRVLEPSKTYYWRIIANDGHGNTVDSGLLSFSTVKVNRKPNAPELISPINSAQNVDYKSVFFQWRCTDPDQDPLKFELYLDGSFVATTTRYDYTINNLQPGKTYSWYVKALDAEYSQISQSSTFTTASVGENRAPNVPQVVSPPDGAQSVNIPVMLQWSCSDPDGDPLSYDLYLNNQKKQTTTQTQYILDNLTPNTTYQWYVVASDGTNTTTGPTWTFTTKGISNTPPTAPKNPKPEDKSTVYSTEVTLNWECSDPDDDTLFYDLYFGESSDVAVIRTNLQTAAVLMQNLEPGKRYYWKVVAKDGNSESEGAVWTFYVGTQSVLNKLLALKNEGIYSIDFTAQPVSVFEVSTLTGNDFYYYDQGIYVIGDELSILKDSQLATSAISGDRIWVGVLKPVQRIIAGTINACTIDQSTLTILEISDNKASAVASLALNEPSSLFVCGEYIYVCDQDGLKEINAANPYDPILERTYSCNAKDVYVIDNMVYLLTDSKILKLKREDLSEIGFFDFQNGRRICFNNGFVYAINNEKLVQLDDSFSEIEEVDLVATSLAAKGNILYVVSENQITAFDEGLNEIKSIAINGVKEILVTQ